MTPHVSVAAIPPLQQALHLIYYDHSHIPRSLGPYLKLAFAALRLLVGFSVESSILCSDDQHSVRPSRLSHLRVSLKFSQES